MSEFNFYINLNEPDFNSIGSYFLVPFKVQRIKGAKIAWLNRRWFFENNFNIFNDDILRDVKASILNSFGVFAIDLNNSTPASGAWETLFADRYGGSLGRLQGGSGRSGCVGAFNAKGIGKSPLVSSEVDWSHSHGYLWLSEAIREAVLSEVFGAEFPRGAVPVIAIIDTGFYIYDRVNNRYERCAILVRPNVFRPAHLERSIFFGDSGYIGSSQFMDAHRVKAAFGALIHANSEAACEPVDILAYIISSMATQIGAGRAHRLWHGRFLTDNISINGALLDFGSCRAVSCWRRADDGAGQVFGSDESDLKMAIDSLLFYFRKYSVVSQDIRIRQKLIDLSALTISQAFSSAALIALGLNFLSESEKSNIVEIINNYFLIQQRDKISLLRPTSTWGRRPWLYDVFNTDGVTTNTASHSVYDKLAVLFRQTLHSIAVRNGMDFRINVLNAKRWLKPRRYIFYRDFSLYVRRLLRRLDFEFAAEYDEVGSFIDKVISVSRRNWLEVPSYLCVVAQSFRKNTAILKVLDSRDMEEYIFIRAPRSGNKVYILGQEQELIHLEHSLEITDRYISFLLRIGDITQCNMAVIRVGGHEIQLPQFDLTY